MEKKKIFLSYITIYCPTNSLYFFLSVVTAVILAIETETTAKNTILKLNSFVKIFIENNNYEFFDLNYISYKEFLRNIRLYISYKTCMCK